MPIDKRCGGRGIRLLLSSTSIAALLIGAGTPAAFAAPCVNTISASFDNPGGHTTANVCVRNTSFSGGITNEGTISPSGIALVNGTISGAIQSSGIIKGGISLDTSSEINAGTPAAIGIVGPTFQGGIANSGQIQSSGNAGIGVVGVATFQGGISNGNLISGANGISIADGSTFLGGITNNGTIAGGIAGIGIGGFTHSGAAVTQTSFGGGITNTGAISGGQAGIGVENVTQFTDSITNSGTIQSGLFGIFVNNVGFFGSSSAGGGITNSGKITGSTSAAVRITNVSTFAGNIVNSASGTITSGGTGIAVGQPGSPVGNFTGNISNAGTITAGGTAIAVGKQVSVGTFSGNISNSGTISAGNDGIHAEVTAATGTFLGGISNSGVISAGGSGILAAGGATFADGIGNSGTIAAQREGIDVDQPLEFSGGITNSGKISSALSSGIYLAEISSFGGGITNSGTISANKVGIQIEFILSLSGNISNSGTIAAKTGIHIASFGTFVGSTINGSIVDSGAILASAHGILIDAVSAIVSTGTAIKLTGPTFTGGISNNGTISAGGAGIEVAGTTTFLGGISNSGTIMGAAYGIYVDPVVTFAGGISSSGIISVTGAAIALSGIANFTGTISNSGTITGKTGINIAASTVTGAIVDSGKILASVHGILIDNTSKISSGSTAISLSGATFTGGISNAGTIAGVRSGILITGLTTFSGGISNSGTISSTSRTAMFVTGISTFSGGLTNTGTLSAHSAGIDLGLFSTFLGGISNGGTIVANVGIYVTGIAVFGTTSAIGGIVNNGKITATTGVDIIVRNVSNFSGNISNAGTITGNTGILIDPGVTFAAGSAIVNSGTISGVDTAIYASGATSPVTIDQTAGLISGAIRLSANADVFNIFGATVAGNIVGLGASDTLNFAPGAGNTFTYASAYDFTGINAVDVNSGTAVINGNANSATTLTVSNAGTLAGTGTIATAMTIKSGGIFAPGSGTPGTAMTVTGSLAFQSGAFYMVQLNQTTSSLAEVTGTASLNGTVKANFASGSGYVQKQYTILATTAGLGGTTFAGITTTNLPTGFFAVLSYNADDAFLNLDAGLSLVSGLNGNQQNVATALSNYFNNGGTLPPNFVTIFGLTGSQLGTALSQLDGEDGTGAEHGAFQLMTEFLGLMLDPWTGGGASSGGGGTTGFAAENDGGLPPNVALAYARALKKQAPSQPQQQQDFDQRWSSWASGYGGSSTSEGNAVIGSNNLTASTYGYAAGMDYRVTPEMIYGFALSGGGTNWSLAQNLGGGRSDAFQAGVHGTTHAGPLYLSGALAFANHWFTTNRIAALGDELRAKFEGQSYAVRAEAGYRYAVLPMVGFTPYAALQVQDFHIPSYAETDLTGGGFGLSYNALNATDTRSELGARVDDLTMLGAMPLVLRGRLAWAHDWVSNPSLGAVFQALPGSNFTVNGAVIPHDSALTTAAAELHLNASWTVMAKFDGEFASTSQTYAGTGTLRYAW